MPSVMNGRSLQKMHNQLTRIMYIISQCWYLHIPHESSKEAFYCLYDLLCVTVIYLKFCCFFKIIPFLQHFFLLCILNFISFFIITTSYNLKHSPNVFFSRVVKSQFVCLQIYLGMPLSFPKSKHFSRYNRLNN